MAIPGQTPGESEFSWGPGMFPNPEIDFDPGGQVSKFPRPDGGVTYQDVARGQGTLHDQLRVMAAAKRINTMGEKEEADPTVAGNPDRFGPQLPLVRTKPFVTFPPPKLQPIAGFKREE